MIEKITQIFKVKELRDKILFILGILVVFRLAANIPVPGVNVSQLKSFFENKIDLFKYTNINNIKKEIGFSEGEKLVLNGFNIKTIK